MMGTQGVGFGRTHSPEGHSIEQDSLEKHHPTAISVQLVDTGAELVSGEHVELDPAEARRVRSAFLFSRPVISLRFNTST